MTATTPPTIADYLKYANLKMAAEAFLVSGSLDTPKVGQRYIDALTTGNEHSSKFTESQGTLFTQQWEVVAQKPDTSTGFSGTLFKNRATGELVMSLRSTELVDDAACDKSDDGTALFELSGSDLKITVSGSNSGSITIKNWSPSKSLGVTLSDVASPLPPIKAGSVAVYLNTSPLPAGVPDFGSANRQPDFVTSLNAYIDLNPISHWVNASTDVSGGNDVIKLGDGDDYVDVGRVYQGTQVFTPGQDADYVSTGGGNDTILTGYGSDTIFSGAGNDYVWSGRYAATQVRDPADAASKDFIDTGAGNDGVTAGMGNDTVLLGAGDDGASGMLGDDRLIGGLGCGIPACRTSVSHRLRSRGRCTSGISNGWCRMERWCSVPATTANWLRRPGTATRHVGANGLPGGNEHPGSQGIAHSEVV